MVDRDNVGVVDLSHKRPAPPMVAREDGRAGYPGAVLSDQMLLHAIHGLHWKFDMSSYLQGVYRAWI